MTPREQQLAGVVDELDWSSTMDDATRLQTLMERCEIDEHGCWLWQGNRFGNGYAMMTVRRRKALVHRLAYQAAKGPIPDGLQVDHLCRVRHCINPDHMEAVTSRVNTLRGIGPTAVNARRTRCIHGHPLSGDNLYVEPSGRRRCRACDRAKATRRMRAGV